MTDPAKTLQPEALPDLYTILRGLAARRLAHERRNHTLQPTDLANEAYLRVAAQTHQPVHSRTQFLSIAAEMIRRILVDHARRRGARKRGAGFARLVLDDLCLPEDRTPPDVLDVDAAIAELARMNERQAKVVELRFFGGLTVDEVAEALGVGRDTIKRDWRFARAWLRARLTP